MTFSWASDRDCKITLWEGRCEALYGYPREDVIGKDYVTLFVASDEQAEARRSQLDIIDNAAVYHNIANDVARTGNTLRLVTNCSRFWDSHTEQYWNAEMGLIIDYIDQEKERLELVIAESKKVQSCVTQFTDNTRQRKVQYQERKKAVKAAIAESKKKAAAIKKLKMFQEKIVPVNTALEELQSNLYQLVDDHLQKIKACADVNSCKTLMLEFDEAYEEAFYRFEDIVVDFEMINSEFSWDNTVMQLRNDTLKNNFEYSRRLDLEVTELSRKADESIDDYKRLEPSSDSLRLIALTARRDAIQAMRNKISAIQEGYTERVQNAIGEDDLKKIRSEMREHYRGIASDLERAKKK